MTSEESITKGLVIINTGDGKGKTTAALGLVLRAWGQGLRPCVIQFIKRPADRYGEMRAAEHLGIEWHTAGAGFTRRPESSTRSIEAAREGWTLGQAKIASDEYDLIVLDEFTYVLKYGWLDAIEAITWLRKHRPPRLHLIITGRGAPSALIDYADMVTDMCLVKHPYNQGVKAQVGIEF